MDLILGLDISTTCVGVSLVAYDKANDNIKILDITHIKPKSNKNITSDESMFYKTKVIMDSLSRYKEYNITKIVIEEPLMGSNNVFTVSTLMKFNGMLSQLLYNEFNIVPKYISSHDARKYAFPDLMTVRKYKKNGDVRTETDIIKSLKKNELVLFGSYPWDISKKMVLWEKISSIYTDIVWVYDKNGELKKENFDSSDALVCVLGYINKFEKEYKEPIVLSYSKDKTCLTYSVDFCGKIQEFQCFCE